MKNKQSILHLVPKSSFYNSKSEVINKGLQIHKELFEEDRELYTYLLYFTNSTYYAKSVIMQNLLGNSLLKESHSHILAKDPQLIQIEDKLFHHTLFNENMTHALKMLISLKNERVNNSRTTKVILDFIFNRGNADFIVIKYKNKVRQLLVHALGLKTVNDILNENKLGEKAFKKHIDSYKNPFAKEIFKFVFDKEYSFTSPYLKEYIQVKNDFKNNTVSFNKKVSLPVEVLSGFNNFYKRNINLTTLLSAGNVSEKQKIQMQNVVKKHSNDTLELKIDLNKYSIMELFKYMYNKSDITEEEVNEVNTIIDKKAKEIRNGLSDAFFTAMLEKTAIIVDCSESNFGSQESKLHPLFKNLTLSRIFEYKDNVFYVGGEVNDLELIVPSGDSNLTQGLLEAVKKGYTKVIVLSDGFENVGSFEKVYEQLKTIGYDLNVIHFNPVFSPKNLEYKKIGEDIFTLPYTNEKDIENLVLFYYLETDKDKFKVLLRSKIENELLG